jgi:hypothetical protein
MATANDDRPTDGREGNPGGGVVMGPTLVSVWKRVNELDDGDGEHNF